MHSSYAAFTALSPQIPKNRVEINKICIFTNAQQRNVNSQLHNLFLLKMNKLESSMYFKKEKSYALKIGKYFSINFTP